MGKKKQRQGGPNLLNNGSGNPISLREEITGIKHGIGGSKNAKSLLKHEYLTKLAVWAGREASIPNLAAFFGQRVAALGEALGAPSDHSFISCQRCETILQPGFNCTIRIEKNKSRARSKHKKPVRIPKNNVVFKCNFCSHRNIMKGTPKGYLKEIYPSSSKVSATPEPTISLLQKCANSEKDTTEKEETPNKEEETPKREDNALPSVIPLPDVSPTKNPQTPLARTVPTLLDTRKRNRKRSTSKEVAEPESSPAAMDADKSVSTRNKRKRKSWTSLKEIANSSEHNSTRSIFDLTIPFKI